MKLLRSALFWSLFLAIALPSFGQYTLSISSVSKNVRFDYLVSTAAEVVESISIRHKGDAVNVFLGFSSGQSGSASNRALVGAVDTLSYSLVDSAASGNLLLDVGDSPTSANVLTASLPASATFQTVTLSYTLEVAANIYVSKDTYDDTVDVTLYSGDLTTYVVEDSASVVYTATVPEFIEVSVIPAGSPFDPLQSSLSLDFGILDENETLTGDIVVRANAIYTLSLQSGAKGVMTNTDPTDKSEVPYEFLFDSAPVVLTSNKAVDVAIDQPVTAATGKRYSFDVTILPYGMASEGTYQDSITITVSAQ